MNLRLLLILAMALPVIACRMSVTVPDQPVSPAASAQARLEAELIPVVTFVGEEDSRKSLAERQGELGVPAVSVAVLRNGKLSWARAYGEGISTRTQFQAASLSKTVAAAGLLLLAEEQGVSIDDDIASVLPVDLATLNPEAYPLTLRKLLSHTNGTAVSGFPGYVVGGDVPTTSQVVMGSGPANTEPVTVSANPAGERRYSGGGYTIAQLWAETVTGDPFADVMARLVLEPLEMNDSTFVQSAPADTPTADRARAFGAAGDPVAGGWHLYPEMAAAGLWTTPTDYLKFVAAILAGIDGRNAGLAPEVARAMATEVAGEYGLGIGVKAIGETIRLSHSGSNRGYRCNFMAYPSPGDAVITMTNAAGGWPLVGDVGRTANVIYGWPSAPPIIRERAQVTAEELEGIAGTYGRVGGTDPSFMLAASGRQLLGQTPDGGFRFKLVKIGPTTYIDPDDGEEVEINRAPDGAVTIQTANNQYFKM